MTLCKTTTRDATVLHATRNTKIEHGNTPEWAATSEKAATNSRTGNECHLPMGGSPPMKNYDNRPFSTLANDGDYDESACECAELDEYPDASASDTAAI